MRQLAEGGPLAAGTPRRDAHRSERLGGAHGMAGLARDGLGDMSGRAVELEGAVVAVLGLAVTYFLGRRRVDTPRKRAWVLSAAASVVLSTLGLRAALRCASDQLSLDCYTDEDVAARLCVAFFVVFLITDLVVAQVDYPSEMSMLSGWVHHLGYVALSVYVLHHHSSNLLTLFLLEEFPTLILALGHLGVYRTELGFGGAFFLLRIVYHSVITVVCFIHRDEPEFGRYWIVMIAALALHLHWFVLWCQRQCRMLGVGKRKAKVELQRASAKREAGDKEEKAPSLWSATAFSDDEDDDAPADHERGK